MSEKTSVYQTYVVDRLEIASHVPGCSRKYGGGCCTCKRATVIIEDSVGRPVPLGARGGQPE